MQIVHRVMAEKAKQGFQQYAVRLRNGCLMQRTAPCKGNASRKFLNSYISSETGFKLAIYVKTY